MVQDELVQEPFHTCLARALQRGVAVVKENAASAEPLGQEKDF